MRVTRNMMAARCSQLQAQLDAQGNPGRIRLKASLAEALKNIEARDKKIEGLNLKITSLDQSVDRLTDKNKELEAAIKATKEEA
jgi:peptidoglycan hydrolase CwlO-like protein